MDELADNQVIAALGRMVVADLAPQELAQFEQISAAYFRHPTGTRPAKVAKDATLGLQVVEAIGYITPLVLALANEVVVQFLSDRLQSSAMRRGRRLLGHLGWKRRSGETAEDVDPGTAERLILRPEQLVEVHRVALEKAKQMDLPDAHALLLADAIVGSLNLIAVDRDPS